MRNTAAATWNAIESKMLFLPSNDRQYSLLRLIHSSLLFSFSITVLRFFAVHTLTHGILVLIERVARESNHATLSINRRGAYNKQDRSRGVSVYVVTAAAAMHFRRHARAFLFVWHYLGVSRIGYVILLFNFLHLLILFRFPICVSMKNLWGN